MEHKYTAKIYSGDKEVDTKTGDDMEKLNTWMVSHINGNSSSLRGDIIDNKTKEVVRRFKKTPIE